MNIRKNWFFGVLFLGILLLLGACSNDNSNQTEAEEENENNEEESGPMTFTESFEDHLWFKTTDEEPDRNSQATDIYKFEDNKVIQYTPEDTSWELEDVVDLSNEEILEGAEVDEEYEYEIKIKLDDTGNRAERLYVKDKNASEDSDEEDILVLGDEPVEQELYDKFAMGFLSSPATLGGGYDSSFVTIVDDLDSPIDLDDSDEGKDNITVE